MILKKKINTINTILLGPPGSGKGTQSERIILRFGYVHLSPGILFRKHVADQTALGKKIQIPMQNGELLEDNLVIDIMHQTITSIGSRKGFLFDGFPRTLVQAKALDVLMQEEKEKIDLVIVLDVPEEEIIRRLKDRSIKHQRPDDQDEIKVSTRIKTYYQNLPALLEYYKSKAIHVDADKEKQEVFRYIKNIIEVVI